MNRQKLIRSFKANQGFSLVEVLVTTMLIVTVATFTGRYFVGSKIVSQKSQEMFSATQAAITSIETIKDVFKNNPDSLERLVNRIRFYAEELNYSVHSNGWGDVEINMSNGERGSNDGRPMIMNQVQYERGFGAHAPSEIIIPLQGNYELFKVTVGIDDEVERDSSAYWVRPSVIFKIYADRTLKYTSPLIRGTTTPIDVKLDVKNMTYLSLVVENGGDGNSWDHANWANPRLFKSIKDSTYLSQNNSSYNVDLNYQAVTGRFNAIKMIADVKVDGQSQAKLGTGLHY